MVLWLVLTGGCRIKMSINFILQMDIDFVVTWLDSSDPKWREEFRKYKGITTTADLSKARYRDWDYFKYWFRAVEKYAPWVHKVFVITNGKFPDWINPDCDKLVLVKHSDYIPEQFLPTFNSRTIEFYMNRIKGLSEYFVYFNDDFYLNNPVCPDYYFKNGLPCDCNSETVYNVPKYNPVDKFNIKIGLLTNIGVVNGHFDRRQTIRQSWKKWHGFHLGLVDRMMRLVISAYPHGLFVGFRNRHFEQPYLKSVFDDAWDKASDVLYKSSTRFREDATLTPYFFRYWQFASNKFYPVKLNNYRKFVMMPSDLQKILDALHNPRIKSLCLNDTSYCTDEDYSIVKPVLHEAFEKKDPEKCSFEL